MALHNKIYLIGFMGSGKSTAGKKLAAIMGWSFIDLDRKVEEHAGQTIPQIFSEHGENYFRKLEILVLRDLCTVKNAVISTGGGVPCHSDNMSFMKETGLTVYLRLTPAQLQNRLSESKTERPLIRGLKNEDLLTFIEDRLLQREPFYSQAAITIDGFSIDYKSLMELISERIE